MIVWIMSDKITDLLCDWICSFKKGKEILSYDLKRKGDE